jgi:hypothetical protein
MTKQISAEELLAVKVTITDRDALARIDPAAVIRYLTAHGWSKVGAAHAKGEIKGSEWGKGGVLLLVPSGKLADTVLRMSDIVLGLGVVERRSQMLILRDLLSA